MRASDLYAELTRLGVDTPELDMNVVLNVQLGDQVLIVRLVEARVRFKPEHAGVVQVELVGEK